MHKEQIKQIQHLNSLHNSLLPIAKLPTEVLSRIFGFYVEELRLSSVEECALDTPAGWLSFTQVCQRWRSVALETSTLWCVPNFRFRELALEMVKRSRTAPLHVLLYSDVKIELIRVVCKEVLQKESARIAAIDVLLTIDCMNLLMEAIRETPGFPILHTLSIIADDTFPPERASSLPSNLLLVPPPIRNVTLYNLDLVTFWSPGLFKGLSSLRLLLDEDFGSPLPFERLLSLLKECGQLEELTLWDCLELPSPARISELKPVNLSHLRRLDLREENFSIFSLFSDLVSFPNLLFIRLEIFISDESISQNQARLQRTLTQLLCSPFEPSSNPTFREPLHFLDMSQHNFGSHLNFHHTSKMGARFQDTPANVSVTFCHTTAHVQKIMVTLLDVVPLSQLQLEKLSFCMGRDDTPLDLLLKHFGTLKVLEDLVIEGDRTSVRPFLDALGREIFEEGDSDGTPSRRCAFERLRTIRLKKIARVVFEMQVAPLGDLLVKSLRRRKEAIGTVGIESIRLDEGFLLEEEEELREVRGLVPDTEIVRWKTVP